MNWLRKSKTTTKPLSSGWNPDPLDLPFRIEEGHQETGVTQVRVGLRSRDKRRSARSATPAVRARTNDTRPAAKPWKRHQMLARLGWYEVHVPAIKSTTRQIEALNLAVSGPPASPRGLIWGQEAESGQTFYHDPFTAYLDGLISSPNVVVIGDVGRGKSALLKTWAVMRQLLLGRRVVVIDKKRDLATGRGEYLSLVQAVGGRIVRFTLDGTGERINPVDPAIAMREGSDEAGPAGQTMLLRAMLAEALGRALTPTEGKAMRVALRTATKLAGEQGRDPIIGDVVEAMMRPDPRESALALREVTAEELALLDGPVRQEPDEAVARAQITARMTAATRKLIVWGQDPALELERMIEEDLQGLVDGPTSAGVHLDAALTIFDVSALPETGPALPIVMSIIDTWLSNVLANQKVVVPTLMVVEEGWHLVRGSFAAVSQRNSKQARGYGMATLAAFHHLTDVPEDSPAIAMIQEAETVVVYRQSKRPAAEQCVRLLDLPEAAVETLLRLPVGAALVKIGSQDPILVSHLRSDLEVQVTNTDAAMAGAGILVDEVADLAPTLADVDAL